MAMKKILSNKARFFEQVTFTADDEVYVGIDVHKKTYHLAIWLNGNIVLTYVTSADNQALIQQLRRLEPGLRKVVYEAGPTGFGLVRALRAASLPAAVIAPSKTLRPSGPESKSDRLDCRKIAEFAAKDLLTEVTIPTEQEEADRQVTRLRNQLNSKCIRIKQQIKSFLLQHGIPEHEGLTRWTQLSLQSLRDLELGSELRFTLNVMLDELEYLQSQLKRVDKQLEVLFREERHVHQIRILTSHPGVGPITSKLFLAEVYQPNRFEKSTQVARYLGLAPRVSQSGQKRVEGKLMKQGQIKLRACLVEAAWAWIREDPDAKETFRRLLRNTGEPNKAIAALARRLAIHLWKMLCDEQVYRKAA
jgi:transposase